MPAYLPVTAETVNYAPVVFVGFVTIASVWYFVWGRKHYRGPPAESVGLATVSHHPELADAPPTKKD